MSYFERFIPREIAYYKKFRELDELDFRIVSAMMKVGIEGPRNVSKVAKELGLPQQTINYRVLRFDREDLIRFSAVVNESYLGLASYAVIANVRYDLTYENRNGTAVNSGTFLTCLPVWRLLDEVQGGTTHGFFVLYAIPPQKEKDLRTFLDELKGRKCITQVEEFCRVTQSHYNNPPLELYLSMVKANIRNEHVLFKWERWVEEFDKAEEITILEDEAHKAPFTYKDLLVLFHLEKNVRERFVDIAKSVGESSSKVAKRYEEIVRRGLISRCRYEIFPATPITAMHLTLRLDFSDESSLRKFASHLNAIPYPVKYQKVIGKGILFLHLMVPIREFFDFHNVLKILRRQYEIVKNIDLYVGNQHAKFENLKLYDSFSKEENDWAFSFDTMMKAFRRLVRDTQIRFM